MKNGGKQEEERKADKEVVEDRDAKGWFIYILYVLLSLYNQQKSTVQNIVRYFNIIDYY